MFNGCGVSVRVRNHSSHLDNALDTVLVWLLEPLGIHVYCDGQVAHGLLMLDLSVQTYRHKNDIPNSTLRLPLQRILVSLRTYPSIARMVL